MITAKSASNRTRITAENMTKQEYEKARQQCWNAAALNNRLDEAEENKERFFDFVFDNAFALGMKSTNKQQWINVEEALPQLDLTVLTYYTDHNQGPTLAVAHWDGEDWYTTDGKHIRPDYWMNIPPLNPRRNKTKQLGLFE